MVIIARETLEITSDVAELATIRGFLRSFATDRDADKLNEEEMAQLELAVNEAAANVMKHAYMGRTDRPLRVEMSSDDKAVTVCLIHKGETFERRDVPPPSFDGSRDNGFGVYLIENCVDTVEYSENSAGEQCVNLTKFFSSN
ncbi:MAG: ATP-binding protein [Candidatus Latescibacteria bacterium]|mgnify:CR=1 FL=1|nr:ATP-binding protein [Candidatus Latescibacterota bacterium]